MATLNRVELIGNLTHDVEVRQTNNGTKVCDIGIAVNERKKDGTQETVFVDATLWERNAEIAAQYLKKGSLIFLEGKLRLDKWQTQDGESRQKLCVTGFRFQMLDKPPAQQEQQQQRQAQPAQGGGGPDAAAWSDF